MYHTKRRYSATNKMIKSCKRTIHTIISLLHKKTQANTSTSGKFFAGLYNSVQRKASSLGLRGTTKILFSIVTISIFTMVIISTGDKGAVLVFADNSLNIKEIDDAYISLDGAILDSNDDFGARFSYIIKPGDTLESIAHEFGSTVKSLMSTNGLSSISIKPGQELIISSVDGFVYQMTKPMTIRDFASEYRLDLQDIKELNSLQNDHDTLVQGDQLFVPLTFEEGKKMGLIIPEPEPEPVVQNVESKPSKTSTKTTITTKINKTTVKTSGGAWRVSQSRSSCFGFVPGQCTCYAAQKRPDIFKAGQSRPFGGNAKNRYDNARNAGFDVGTKPAIGAVAVMPMGWGGYGHVGIVVDIDGDQILLESMNRVGNYIVNRIWISNSRVRGYIY